jgi:F-type H+-transporting ATPase subunit delta
MPHMLQAPRAFRWAVGAHFQAVDAEAPIPEFAGPGTRPRLEKRPSGRKGVIAVAGEVDTPSGVAGRYATALFELALEENALEKVEADLNRFNQALDAVEDLNRLVRSPVFSAEEQERAIAAILEKIEIEGLAANFLKIIARNRRLFAASDMIKAFRARLARHRGQTSAEVTSAVPLEEGQVRALQAALKAALHKDVQLDQKVDATLLGGLVVKVGSRMVDSSLRTKLTSLKHAMKEVG